MICPRRLDCLSLTERVSGVLFQRVNYFDFQIRKRFHRIRWVPTILHRTIEAALFSSHPPSSPWTCYCYGRASATFIPICLLLVSYNRLRQRMTLNTNLNRSSKARGSTSSAAKGYLVTPSSFLRTPGRLFLLCAYANAERFSLGSFSRRFSIVVGGMKSYHSNKIHRSVLEASCC